MKSAYDEAVRLLPSKTAAALGERFKTAEEFRLRAGRYPCALIGGREEAIADRAVTRDDIACVLEKATNASLHAVWQDMSKGFIDRCINEISLEQQTLRLSLSSNKRMYIGIGGATGLIIAIVLI